MGCFSNILEKKIPADSHSGFKKKKKKEMSREGESSVSFKTWVLGSRRRGEQPRLIKQRAGRSNYRLLTQESPFTCLKLDQRHG